MRSGALRSAVLQLACWGSGGNPPSSGGSSPLAGDFSPLSGSYRSSSVVDGMKTERPIFDEQIAVRLPSALRGQLEAAARAVDRPVGWWVRRQLEAALANTERRAEQQQGGGARAA